MGIKQVLGAKCPVSESIKVWVLTVVERAVYDEARRASLWILLSFMGCRCFWFHEAPVYLILSNVDFAKHGVGGSRTWKWSRGNGPQTPPRVLRLKIRLAGEFSFL